MKDRNSLVGVVVLVLLAVVIALLFPLAVLWSINTLFGLGIVYTFWTWLATFVLLVAISGRSSIRR